MNSYCARWTSDRANPPKQIVAIGKCRNSFVSRHLHQKTTVCGMHSTKLRRIEMADNYTKLLKHTTDMPQLPFKKEQTQNSTYH